MRGVDVATIGVTLEPTEGPPLPWVDNDPTDSDYIVCPSCQWCHNPWDLADWDEALARSREQGEPPGGIVDCHCCGLRLVWGMNVRINFDTRDLEAER